MATRTEEQKAKMAAAQQLRRANERNSAKPSSTLLRDIPGSLHAAILERDKEIARLTDEVRSLKRQLAAKVIRTPTEHAAVRGGDLAHLPEADRKFLERKLGIKR